MQEEAQDNTSSKSKLANEIEDSLGMLQLEKHPVFV